MPELDDHQLLAEFARESSHDSFAAIVQRHVNLVYSTALRSVGNEHSAQEISQAVFIILARKAATLSAKTILSGWLYQTTRLTAANFLRGEIRRQKREQEAYMQSAFNEPEANVWPQVTWMLDDEVAKLGERDRNAIVLRFFENKSLGNVGRAMGASEDAAKMRVNRALEKLRKAFMKRGVTLTTAAIAGAISANSVQAAPAGLALTISASVKGTILSTTLTTLINTTMKTMTWIKFKFAAGVCAATLLAGGVATVALCQTSHDGSQLTVQEIVNRAKDAYAALSSYSDDGKTTSTVGSTVVAPHTFTIKLARPNLYRVAWRQDSMFYVQAGAAWSAGAGDFLKMGDSTQKCSSQEAALSGATGISGGAAGSIPGTFFKMNWGNQFGPVIKSATRKADEKIGDTDCYVLTEEKDGRTRTLWIGKQDFLIHQIENVTSAEAMRTMMETEAKKHPELKLMMLTNGQESKSIENHEHIVVNQKFSQADFAE
jgi:RNA polymerase sigma factor (sigma-70 family)